MNGSRPGIPERRSEKVDRELFLSTIDLLWGRMGISIPSVFVAVAAKDSSTSGEPRLTLRRSGVNSASV
ncbi:MAG: hypothetical protein H7Z17_20745 [Fuerstia sp.]|nr:hypothetical protein [Fuerstiella sp.]